MSEQRIYDTAYVNKLEALLALLHSAVFKSSKERGGRSFKEVVADYHRLRAETAIQEVETDE